VGPFLSPHRKTAMKMRSPSVRGQAPSPEPPHTSDRTGASVRASSGLSESERALGWALAAAAGLCLGACQQADEKPSGSKAAASTGSEAKNCCHGKNACKGQGGCAVPGKNDCAGKNACKGQGGCNMHCPK